ncbi:TolB family protein [Cohnella sp. JJ-181]|uniref:TolB family protein n=1 Tax=Cohnella rhizoplanae TaxID=2974897 RepID=UPI0022FFA4CD|nr:WD40 repeat domain-containing protein [Cohnella sp. JJ-181]CAI6082692.1 hypothetical protein COHCIP112018_03726 [Cohnella sp. JJ-181]
MPNKKGEIAVKLTLLLTLAFELTACSAKNGEPVPVASGAEAGGTDGPAAPGADGGKRKLTVVRETDAPKRTEVAIDRIHRIEGASIDAWLSDDAVRITTTKRLSPGTETEEAKYSYTTETVNLLDDARSADRQADADRSKAALVKETPSPDGKFAFVQQWKDHYTARNFVKNVASGDMIEIKAANYIESGGWLDADTYVLAAGAMDGRGDVLVIETDGTVSKMELDDPQIEMFAKFTASRGSVYYTDQAQNLKAVAYGTATKPTLLASGVTGFEIAPDGARIAVTTADGTDGTGEKLLLYGADGRTQGSAAIGKGDLIPYMSWSADASKLAFAVYAEDRSGMNGVYLFDAASGIVVPVVPNAFPQYPLSWNPSGTRLGVTAAGKGDLPATEIIDFKTQTQQTP